jgi:hypothetical protein
MHRIRMLVALGALLTLAALPALAYGSRSKGPTAAQIRTAIRRAEQSRDLWATVNICNTTHHPDVIGIRAQMPALGFLARLRMDLGVEYLADHAFKPVPTTTRSISIAPVRSGLQQGGITFSFPPHAGYFRGSATFEWSRDSKLLGRVTVKTSPGHRTADFGDPPGFSSWNCVMR